MHTCTCYSHMRTHVIVQFIPPHLSVVNCEMARVYSVQCTQCIHRNVVYVMLQNSDNVYASKDHSDILCNVLHILAMSYTASCPLTSIHRSLFCTIFTDSLCLPRHLPYFPPTYRRHFMFLLQKG